MFANTLESETVIRCYHSCNISNFTTMGLEH